MLKNWVKVIGIAALSSSFVLGLAGCQSGQMNNQGVGTVAGGALGGLIGSRFGGGSGRLIATGVGVLVGAMTGNAVGKNMDDQDKQNMQGALTQTPSDKTVQWNNDSGVHYTFTPTTPVMKEPKHGRSHGRHRYCREFTQTAEIAGKQQQIYGRACRQPDGTWQVVKSHK